LAIKYLDAKRIRGTATERTAMTTATSPQTSWKELARTTLGCAGDTIDVPFTAKDNLMFLSYGIPSGTIQWELGFGTGGSFDTGTNCATRISRNGSELTRTSQDTIESEHDVTADQFCVGTIRNIASKEKHCLAQEVTSNGAGAGNAPTRVEIAGKYANTSAQINFLRFGNPAGGDYASGSELVVLGCDDDEADSGTNFWQELSSVELSSSNGTLSSGTIAAKKYLRVQAYLYNSGTMDTGLRFNSDSGSNYAQRLSDDGAADSTSASYPKLTFDRANKPCFVDLLIINKSDKEKLVIAEQHSQGTAGASNAPQRREMAGKWANTSAQITQIDFVKQGSGADLTAPSRIRVWGSN